MRNEHNWKHVTEHGEKREVRAVKFGKAWRFSSKLKSEGVWTYHDEPSLDDLIGFHDILFRKYQRRRATYEDVVFLERWIEQRKAAAAIRLNTRLLQRTQQFSGIANSSALCHRSS